MDNYICNRAYACKFGCHHKKAHSIGTCCLDEYCNSTMKEVKCESIRKIKINKIEKYAKHFCG